MIGLGILPGYAAQGSLQFNVTVQLAETDSANPALCRSSTTIGAFGSVVTVICSTGEIASFSGDTTGLPWTAMQHGAFRYVASTSSSGKPVGTVNSPGGRAVTSWRVVRLAKLEYVELMVSL